MRLLVVIDVELGKLDRFKRLLALKKLVSDLLKNRSIPDKIHFRKTNMKGFRAVFMDEKDLNDYLFEVGTSELVDLNWVQQSESDYATIFFLEESEKLLDAIIFSERK